MPTHAVYNWFPNETILCLPVSFVISIEMTLYHCALAFKLKCICSIHLIIAKQMNTKL